MNFAEQIVIGSREIDRMKGEVVAVISTITGLLLEERRPQRRIEFTTGDIYHWEYTLVPDAPTQVYVRCFVPQATDEPDQNMRCVLVFEGKREEMRFRYQNVKLVYDQLEGFVHKMLDHFPGLLKTLDPIWKASEARSRFD